MKTLRSKFDTFSVTVIFSFSKVIFLKTKIRELCEKCYFVDNHYLIMEIENELFVFWAYRNEYASNLTGNKLF